MFSISVPCVVGDIGKLGSVNTKPKITISDAVETHSRWLIDETNTSDFVGTKAIVIIDSFKPS